MAEDDAVILVTHQPRWLAEWFWEETGSHNLRQLVRGSLRGRARVWLSGLPCKPCHPAACMTNPVPSTRCQAGASVKTHAYRAAGHCL
jgi:hypothetical protein